METKVDTKPELLARGYELLTSKPQDALDLLSEAARTLEGDDRHEAIIYTARAYFNLGQYDEGRVVVIQILREPLSPENRAHALLEWAVLDKDYPKRALAHLNKIDISEVSAGLRARIHNKRARIYSDSKNLDLALIEYAGAAALFEEAGQPEGTAHAFNNQASVYRKLERFEEAHESVNKALQIESQNLMTVSQFRDQKASIYLAEFRFRAAEQWALKALSLVEDTDLHGAIVDALCTLGQAYIGQGRYEQGAASFGRASKIADSVDCAEMAFNILTARKMAVERFLKSIESDRIQLALKMAKDSYRQAAKIMGISHTALMKAMTRNNLSRKPKRPVSIISKPHKDIRKTTDTLLK